MTPVLKYWLGFFAADGCIYQRNNRPGYTLSIMLSNKDSLHLEKLSKFFKVSNKLRTTQRDECVITFKDTHLSDLLITNGITPRKTDKLDLSEELSTSRDFWRGFIDGDGSIYRTGSKYPYYSLKMTMKYKPLMVKYIEFLNSIVKLPNNSITEDSNVCRFKVSSKKNLQQILPVIWYNGCECLERKHNIVKEFLTNG